MAFDIYQTVTDRIIAELEKGSIPWQKPWVSDGGCVSYCTGKPYSLLNQLLLPRPGEYLTFKQVEEEHGRIRKGEKSSMVVFWKWLDKKDEHGEPVIGFDGKPEQVPYLRYYNVFHVDQCENINPRFAKELPEEAYPDEQAEAMLAGYIARSGVTLKNVKGDTAFYRPSTDTIVLPLMAQFVSTAEYYSAAFHEAAHSTGHVTRLNRLDNTAHFGSDVYSREELIAELSAASLLHIAGLETVGSFRNSSAYIQNWLTVLKEDKRAIVAAAGKADKAIRFILGTDDNEKEA